MQRAARTGTSRLAGKREVWGPEEASPSPRACDSCSDSLLPLHPPQRSQNTHSPALEPYTAPVRDGPSRPPPRHCAPRVLASSCSAPAIPWGSLCSLRQLCRLTFTPHGCASVLRGCCARPSFSLVPALCAALPLTTFSASLPSRWCMPHSFSYISFLTTASPSKPSHQLLRHHSSIDRVGQTLQGPFWPPNLVLCFPSKEGWTQAGALSSGVRWSWPHICSPWKVCTDTRKLVFSSPTRRCW